MLALHRRQMGFNTAGNTKAHEGVLGGRDHGPYSVFRPCETVRQKSPTVLRADPLQQFRFLLAFISRVSAVSIAYHSAIDLLKTIWVNFKDLSLKQNRQNYRLVDPLYYFPLPLRVTTHQTPHETTSQVSSSSPVLFTLPPTHRERLQNSALRQTPTRCVLILCVFLSSTCLLVIL